MIAAYAAPRDRQHDESIIDAYSRFSMYRVSTKTAQIEGRPAVSREIWADEFKGTDAQGPLVIDPHNFARETGEGDMQRD